mgnify:CR=1 FL=1
MESSCGTFIKRQESEYQTMEHQAKTPDVYFRTRSIVTFNQLRRHILKAPKIYALPLDPRNRPKNAKIDHFNLNTGLIKLPFGIGGRIGQHDILKLQIPVYDLTIMTIVYRTQQLAENMISVFLIELPLGLGTPKVFELPSF